MGIEWSIACVDEYTVSLCLASLANYLTEHQLLNPVQAYIQYREI